MRPFRAFRSSFRIVIAVLFGFMSLAHGPAMAFAQEKAPQAIQHQPSAQHMSHRGAMASHDAPDHHRHHADTLTAGAAALCYGIGCFVVMAPLPAGAPASDLIELQELVPAPAHAFVSAEPDPSVPPPRLQA